MMRFKLKKGIGLVTLPGFGTFQEADNHILAGDQLQQYVPTFLEVYTGAVAPKAEPIKVVEANGKVVAPVEVGPTMIEVLPSPEAPPLQEQRPNKKGR